MYTESVESELKELKETFEEYNRILRLIFDKQLELLRSLELSTMQRAGDYLENVKRLVETREEIEEFIARFNEYFERKLK